MGVTVNRMFNGLGMNLGNLSRLSNAKTRSISAENFSGEKGKAAMAGSDKEFGWKSSAYIMLPPKGTVTLGEIEGPGAIQSMWFAGDCTHWGCIIRIYWDGQEKPSVEAPMSAFFGLGFNAKTNDDTGRFSLLSSIPVLVAPRRGFNCFWEMPFHKKCVITMENVTETEKTCFYQINYTLTDVPDDVAYFHAQYRQQRPVDYQKEYIILDGVKGKGHYVGTTLSVGLNQAGGWWGEGEIKFFLDGDKKFPTICGTGTEDYFGGAYNWDVEDHYMTYSGPYMGMFTLTKPDGLYASQMRFSMYRWHIMDPIRFDEDIKVTLMDLGWKNSGFFARRDDFLSVAYWYQTLPTAPFPAFPKDEELEII